MNIEKPEKIDLRGYWNNETTVFTPWLAKEDSIRQISDAIGIELEVVWQERMLSLLGLICYSLTKETIMCLENQHDFTNHKQLCHIMTFSAKLNAVSLYGLPASLLMNTTQQ